MNEIVVNGPNGVTIRFPAGTDPATIDRVMREATGMAAPAGAAPVDMTRAANPSPAAPQPVGPDTTPLQWNPATRRFERPAPGSPGSPYQVPTDDYTGPPPPTAVSTQPGANERAFELGLQGVGAGLADAAGAPVDLANAFFNLLYSGVNKLAGREVIPLQTNPFGGSNMLREIATPIAEGVGLDVLDREEMAPGEALRYDISRFGTGAAAGSGVSARTAAALRPHGGAAPPTTPRMVDALTAPYAGAPGRAFTGDVAAGVGAGTANWGYEQFAPEALQESAYGPLGNILASIVGGVGGASTLAVAETAGRGAVNAATGLVRGPNAVDAPVNSTTGQPYRRQDLADAAAIVQDRATGWGRNEYDSMLAAAEIEAMQNQLGHFSGPDSLPTTGVASGNPGLIALEQRARSQMPADFVRRDNATRQAAVDTAQRIAPSAAAGRQFTNAAAEMDANRVAAARTEVDDIQEQIRQAEIAGREAAAPLDMRSPLRAQETAALAIDDTVVNQTLRPMQDASARQFADVDPDRAAVIDVAPAIAAAERVRSSLGVLADPSTVIPAGLLGRIERTAAPEADDIGAAVRAAELADDVPTDNVARYWQERDALVGGDATPAAVQRWEAEQLPTLFTEEELLSATYTSRLAQDIVATFDEIARGVMPPGIRNPDEAYAALFSAGRRVPLRKGETWRQRALNVLAKERAQQLRGQSATPTTGARIRDAELSDDDPGVLGALGIGENAAPEVAVGDIVAVWPEISRAIDGARRSGNYVLADNLQALRDGLNNAIEIAANEGNEAAQRALAARQNFSDTLGTTFGRDQPVSQQLRRDYNLNRGGRSETPPSATAGQYLRTGQPERATELQNIIAKSASPEAGQQAVQDYLMADLAATGVLDRSGYLRPDAMRRWIDKWGRALDIASPDTRAMVDELMVQAEAGQAVRGEMASELRAAAARLSDAEKNKGAFAFVLGNNPSNAVNAIFQGGDPEMAVRQILDQIGTNAAAMDGFKAAVREYMTERMTTSAVGATTDGSNPLAFGKLDTLFKRHEETLALIFSPEEMNALQAARAFLRLLNNLRQQATPGSATAERTTQQFWNLLEVGLKARYGVLKGGGLLRTIRLWAKTLPNNDSAVNQIMTQMMFDPELAKHLLRMPRSQIDTPRYNRRLNQLLGLAEGARDDQERRDPLAGNVGN